MRIALALLALLMWSPQQVLAQAAADMPEKFERVTAGFDYDLRTVEIPMRDGVKLHTVIVLPRGGRQLPMLLTRTPYDAEGMTGHLRSSHLVDALEGYDNFPELFADGRYIRVVQDIRGKYGSEGAYIVNRPLRGPLNDSATDHATDTWDTVDWLSRHVPESNGKVGILGISYDGFTSLMALVKPHPALKAVAAMNPMVDNWKGDDWFHNGAFRQINLPYIYSQVGTRANSVTWWDDTPDQYTLFLRGGSAGALASARGMDDIGFYRKLLAHPAYDAFWQQQAVDRVLAQQPLEVPTMLVHSLWDQEDIYGAMAVYRALARDGAERARLWLVMGPWNHGGEQGEGSALGAIRLGSDTSRTFVHDMLRPFLDHFLQDQAPALSLAHVNAFRTGENRWESMSELPRACASGCPVQPRRLYLQPGMRAGFTPGATGQAGYTADPAKPVPYLPLPILTSEKDSAWGHWLVTDQREMGARPDVLSFVTEPLTQPLRITGMPQVELTVSTSAQDGDFVVKLIDVYPDAVPGQPEMGGYQLMVAADILRARYRQDPARPVQMTPGQLTPLKFSLPQAHHAFLPGHRLMVQVQSSWFPLYDRNPQRWVENIFQAKPEDYLPAQITVQLGGPQASALILPVEGVPAPLPADR